MKILIIFSFLLTVAVAQAKEKKKEPANKNAAIEEAAKKAILQDLRVDIEIKSDASVCGSEPGDIVMAEVHLKKVGRDEKGKLKDRWESIESYSATVKDFEKNGAKAFVREGQCQE